MNQYREREDNLRELGFDSYESYLSSNLWYGIRESVLFAAKRVCVACGGVATQVHHKNYSLMTLRGDTLTMLAAVCRTCHEKIEHDAAGLKDTLQEANRKLAALQAQTNRPERPAAQRDPKRCPCGSLKGYKGHFCKRCKRLPKGERFKLWRTLHRERQTQLQNSATGKTPEGDPRASLARPEDCE